MNCRSASRSQKQSAGSATGCLATRSVYSDLYRKIRAGPRTRGKQDGRRSGPSTALFVGHSRPPRSSAAHAGPTPSPQAPLGSGFLTTRTEGSPAGTVGPRATTESRTARRSGSAREEGRTGHQSSCQHPQAVLGEGSRFSGEGRARTTGCTPQGGGFKVNASTKSSSLGRPESVGPDHKVGRLKTVSYFGGSSQGA